MSLVLKQQQRGSTATKKNVANNVTITSNASGITLADGSNGGLIAANYTLTGGTHEVNITKAPITIGLTRQYDGTTNASSNATDSNTTESYSGLVGSETLTLSGQGSVASKNVSGVLNQLHWALSHLEIKLARLHQAEV